MFDCGCHDNDTSDALNMAFFVHSPSKPTTTQKNNGAFKNLFPTLLHCLQESLLITMKSFSLSNLPKRTSVIKKSMASSLQRASQDKISFQSSSVTSQKNSKCSKDSSSTVEKVHKGDSTILKRNSLSFVNTILCNNLY